MRQHSPLRVQLRGRFPSLPAAIRHGRVESSGDNGQGGWHFLSMQFFLFQTVYHVPVLSSPGQVRRAGEQRHRFSQLGSRAARR